MHLDAHGYKRNTGRGESDSGSLIPWWSRIARLSVTRERETERKRERENWEEDNERSERLFGYEPDRDVDVWDEYQAAMEDPMFAC